MPRSDRNGPVRDQLSSSGSAVKSRYPCSTSAPVAARRTLGFRRCWCVRVGRQRWRTRRALSRAVVADRMDPDDLTAGGDLDGLADDGDLL